MRPDERLQRYLERQLALLAAYGELQSKIEESARAGEADLLAVQAARARELASELTALERAVRPLAARAEGARLRQLQALLAERREAALQAGGRSRAALAGSLQELAGRIRALAARPRTPLSPFSRIGRPTLVDIRS